MHTRTAQSLRWHHTVQVLSWSCGTVGPCKPVVFDDLWESLEVACPFPVFFVTQLEKTATTIMLCLLPILHI